jgi:uncharacterized RDD family membrane protein YckC
VPESRTRKKRSYTPPPTPKAEQPSPRWYAPVMLALMLTGLVWVVTTYIGQGDFPLPIGNWNLAIGFVLMITGFGMTTRWR